MTSDETQLDDGGLGLVSGTAESQVESKLALAAAKGAKKPASDPRDTPAMRQYMAFKKAHPDCLLLFRIGDFYELFDDDAVKISKLLGLTLTQRSAGIPMAGMPYHQLDTYVRRLVALGVRVAVADQLQTPEQAKALGGASAVIERGVTRLLTPGTLVDETLLEDDRPNNLACVCYPPDCDEVMIAVTELSTGRFVLTRCAAVGGAIIDELARRQVSEVVYADTGDGKKPGRVGAILDALGVPGTPQPQWHFRLNEAREAICSQFGVSTLAGFGLEDDDLGLIPAGVLLRYLRQTQALDGATQAGRAAALAKSLGHLQPPRREQAGDCLMLDAATFRSLEIDRTIRGGGAAGNPGGQDRSLVAVFLGPDGPGCCTPMGKRLLRDWLCRPSAILAVIEARQACVATLKEDRRLAGEVEAALKGVQDVPRIAARVALGRATPRDLVALGRSLGKLAALDAAMVNVGALSAHLAALREVRGVLEPLADEIARTCVDEPPTHLREGGLVRDGVDAVLDEARMLQRDAGAWLSEYQSVLMREHNIPGLKVGYNKIFGYYIELPKGQTSRAPAVFARRQTLTNAERYITPELKTFEDKTTTAGARAIEREQQVFEKLCAASAACMAAMARFADTVASLDVLVCFASKAAARRWVRPEVVAEPVLHIVQGRHPVLDDVLGSQFVPNDCVLGGSALPDGAFSPAAALSLITGPNMAGKSTFIRQTALLVLLAHAGAFVPAERAVIGLTDRIFTRVGADDALHAGQSTFMVEMTETANILHHATAHSLVVLDEIGRGTSTLDGLSLAWAIAETLAGGLAAPGKGRKAAGATPTPRALFATHYHEITRLEELLPGRVTNLHVSVKEWPGPDGHTQIVFLHRILPGRTDRSYGLHVAKLAGIPEPTLMRAREVLESLSVEHEGAGVTGGAGTAKNSVQAARAGAKAVKPSSAQMSLFTEFVPHPAVDELARLELDGMTPMQAFDALRKLRATLDRREP